MRVESTDGKHQEIGLYLNNKDGTKVLDKVRSLQPYKPWQFKTSKPYTPSGVWCLASLYLSVLFLAALITFS